MSQTLYGDGAIRRPSLYGSSIENTYAGVLSFMRRNYSRDLNGVDVAISGIPLDLATTFRSGARLGPAAVRAASVQLAELKPFPWGFDPFEDLDEPFISPTLTSVSLAPQEESALAELGISHPVPIRPVPSKVRKMTPPQIESTAVIADAGEVPQKVLQILGETLDFDFTRLTDEELEPVLRNLGALTRQAVQGLQQVLRTRADIKNKLRLGSTMVQESGNNPLKLSGNYEQTLNCMLLGQMGYLSGPQAVRMALKDIQAHQVASFAASRTLLDAAFEQLSPTQLVYRFETASKPGKWSNKDAYYWQQYQLHHQKLSGDQEWRQSQFIKDYARVYEEQAQYINAAWSEFDAR
ncbi:MAG: type VI secretion system-associated FHA domain protein TagH [Gammaproteobacteria bacterium]|nr:type VI secretion system-associated FHA domain protein TagH [Gammaproteobacteria bacterium]